MWYRGVASFESARDDRRRQAPHIHSSMAQSSSGQMPAATTHKWRELALQRHAHFLELYQTGRWKLYYSEHDFLIRMREAVHLLESWDTLSAPAVEEKPASNA
jgi:hypothetical protein